MLDAVCVGEWWREIWWGYQQLIVYVAGVDVAVSERSEWPVLALSGEQ